LHTVNKEIYRRNISSSRISNRVCTKKRRTGGIAADSTDNVYVGDFGENNRIQKFDSNGNFLGKWGTTGSGDGQFLVRHLSVKER
jgi:DNA-binding beta-propeller fold protein YncE